MILSVTCTDNSLADVKPARLGGQQHNLCCSTHSKRLVNGASVDNAQVF